MNYSDTMTKASLDSTVVEDMNQVLAEKIDWDQLSQKTILVSGAAGFLARYFITALLYASDRFELNLRVVGLVRNVQAAEAAYGSLSVHSALDLKHGDVIKQIPQLPRADFIVHAASLSSPKCYQSNPVETMLGNLRGTQNLLEFARISPGSKFLFFSSSEIYGDLSKFDVAEMGESDYGKVDCLGERASYPVSKKASEALACGFAREFGCFVTIVRPFHTYGPGMKLGDGRVFADFVKNVVHGDRISIKSDGRAIRAFCYLSDATVGFIQAMLKGENCNAYNIGNPHAVSNIKDLAIMVSGLRPARKLQIEFKDRLYDNEVKSPYQKQIPNIQKSKLLGWQPTTSLEEGFNRTISFYERGKQAYCKKQAYYNYDKK